MRLAAIPILLGALAGPAAAMDGKGNFHVYGAGTASCSAYLAASPEQKLYAETWIAGYTTAMNRSTSNTYNLLVITIAEAQERIEQYCRENRDRLFAHAVHQLLESLYPKRVQNSPPTEGGISRRAPPPGAPGSEPARARIGARQGSARSGGRACSGSRPGAARPCGADQVRPRRR